MKKHLLFIILSAISFAVCAQNVHFETTFETAKSFSLKTHKPLFVFISVTPPASVANYSDGFSNTGLVESLNSHFITYKVNRADTNALAFIKTYHLSIFPTILVFDSKGGLLLKKSGIDVVASKLLGIANEALSLSKQKSLITYDEEFKNNQLTIPEIKAYVNKRISVGLKDNAEIMEKYIDFLKVSDLSNYDEVLFILKAGPLVDGRAYKAAYLNKEIIDSIYKKEPLIVRNEINNAIITNSLMSAIADKNYFRANATANFTRSSWGGNYRQAIKSSTLNLLRYYQAVKDTTNYLLTAGRYYDQNYMQISADSIKILDQKERSAIQEKLNTSLYSKKPFNIDSISKGNDVVLRRDIISFNTSSFANELNNAAFSFYLTGTKNQSYLIKAMNWSKRSIDLNPIYGYYDTLAHIFYRLGFYLEAENTQLKALALAKKENRDVTMIQKELEKMQNKTL
nr:hypothetical protein [Pseudopedobacter sp.]